MKIKANKKLKTNDEVNVNIGFMEVCERQLIRKKRRTLSLKVKPSATSEQILSAAILKHSRHFRQFNKEKEYVLLYQDETLVETLPGSSEPFTLEKYKQDIGKPYSKITLWLCSKLEFHSSLVFEESTSDSDLPSPGITPKRFDPEIVNIDGDEVNETLKQWNTSSNSSANNQDLKCSSSYLSVTQLPRCPSCFESFTFSEIEEHANRCLDQQIDPVGELSDSTSGSEIFSDHCNDEKNIDTPTTGQSPGESLKNIVKELQKNVANIDTNKSRVVIRRKAVHIPGLFGNTKKKMV